MTYTILGTGNMAWFLGTRLKAAGFICKGVWGRSLKAANDLAKELRCQYISDLASVEDKYDCCIVAVSDHAIAEVTRQLSFENTVVIHTAGSKKLDILKAPNRGVVWLIYSILKNDLPAHRNIPAVIEANTDQAKAATAKIARAVSDMVHEVSREQREWLHLTAVIGNNFTNHLMAICEDICKEQGVTFTLLLPILHQTFGRAIQMSPRASQTGPARRGDTDTMQAQTKLLKEHPEYKKVYKAVSESISKMYED